MIREEEADAITPVIAKWMGRLDSSGTADDTDASATDFDHTEISRAVGDWLLLFFEYVQLPILLTEEILISVA